MNTLRLADPLWLLLLLPAAWALWLSQRRARQAAVLYSSTALVGHLPVTLALRVKRLLPYVRLAGLVLIVLALARPQRGLEEFRLRTEGIAIVMCLDRSGSMQALDFNRDGERIDRLTAVKDVFRNFVEGGGQLAGRADDLIGLVSFGGFAESRSPLTLDHGALVEVLGSVQIAQPIRDPQGRILNQQLLREEQATAIGDAVALAAERLRGAPAKSKVVILLSDGENTAGVVSPEQAAQAAADLNIKIYSIGVGTDGSAPFPAIDAFGRNVLVARRVDLDEETLKMMADTTGGRYFHAQDRESLSQVYAEIDRLEKTVTEGRVYTRYRELFPWLLLPGLALVLLEVLLSATRFRSLP